VQITTEFLSGQIERVAKTVEQAKYQHYHDQGVLDCLTQLRDLSNQPDEPQTTEVDQCPPETQPDTSTLD